METIVSWVAIGMSVASGIFTFYTFRWTAARDRKQATLEAYNRLQAEVFDKLNAYTPSTIRDLCNHTRSAEYKTVSGYLARIEHFCVGINQKIYDRESFYALAHGYFDGPQIRDRIRPMIDKKNERNSGKELFYNDTIKVLEWMDHKSK